jgi:hypothetical protein
MRWVPLLAAGAAALVVFEITRPKLYSHPAMPDVIRAIRIAMFTFALGVPFVLDDPSEETVGSAPTRLWVRRSLRIALAAPLLVAMWLLLARYASYTFEHLPTYSSGVGDLESDLIERNSEAFPLWGLARQFLTLTIAALAFSALGARLLPERIGSVAAGPALLAIIGATMLLPRSYTMFVGDARHRMWAQAGTRWTIGLIVSIVWLWHMCRDPGRPQLRARIRKAFKSSSGGDAAEPPSAALRRAPPDVPALVEPPAVPAPSPSAARRG